MKEPTRIPIALYRTMAGVVPQPVAQLEDAKVPQTSWINFIDRARANKGAEDEA